jgi:hypothetical protein
MIEYIACFVDILALLRRRLKSVMWTGAEADTPSWSQGYGYRYRGYVALEEMKEVLGPALL